MNSSTFSPLLTFSWLDYSIFIGMLGLSALIGIYFGCFGSKQSSRGEYLLGGKSMHMFPVAMSIVASNISALVILAIPADIYRYGAYYVWSLISIVITSLACIYIYMPVFLNLQLISTYQYLLIRFDNKVKTLASFMYTLQILLFNPIVIYLSCLAFTHATGFDLNIIAPVTCILCVFYTAIGGLKAVVWTDTLQTGSILIGLLTVIGMGLSSSGGFMNVLRTSAKGHRLDIFNFNLDPTVRDNFWTFILGNTAMWMVDVAINQGTLQRLRAVPAKAHAQIVMMFAIASIIIKLFTAFIGIVMYARYAKCDPVSSGAIVKLDQIVPYYVMDVGQNIPGVAGLFLAGIFAAALSTLSTNLINLAAIIYTDFVSSFMSVTITENQISKILKLIVLVIGIISTALVFVVEKFEGILQLAVSLGGVTCGTQLGLFTLGMVFPVATTEGALCGGIVGLIFNSYMIFGSQWYHHKGLIPDYRKPISVEGCNSTTIIAAMQPSTISSEDLPFVLFRISFWYYTLYGCIVVILVGLLVSLITRKNNSPVRPELISPVFQFLIPKQQLSELTRYSSVMDKDTNCNQSKGDLNEESL